MSARPGPVFLARRGYRQRRLADAVRLLPMLGIILLLVIPLQWPGDGTLPISRAMLFIFGSWIFLAVLTAICLVRFRVSPDPEYWVSDPALGLSLPDQEPEIPPAVPPDTRP